MAIKLTHKQRIERAHIFMMRNANLVWLAPTTMIGNVIIDEHIPTAGTDGRDVIYGATWIDKCNDGQLLATVIHENMHKAYRHMRVYKYLHDKYEKTHPGLVNMAMDYVINRDIKKMADVPDSPVKMWDGLIQYCHDDKYADEMVWDTPRIVEDLLQQAKGGTGGGKGQPGKKGGNPVPGEGEGQDSHDWTGAEEISEAEQEALDKAIEQALRQGQELSKRMAGNVPRAVGDMLTPVIDWRQALRDFVTERVRGGVFQTFARPARRFLHAGVYRPSRYDEAVRGILFAVDTSGSIGPADLQEVLSELHGCIETVKPETVDVIYWDTAVARHEHYSGNDVQNITKTTKPAGGGGTAPSCVVSFCKERNIKPAVAIWLSDGYVGSDWAEDLGVPAFWVISSGGQAPNHLPHAKLPVRR